MLTGLGGFSKTASFKPFCFCFLFVCCLFFFLLFLIQLFLLYKSVTCLNSKMSQRTTKPLMNCATSEDSDQPAHPRSLGPVVQSVVSLTSSLRVISLTFLMDSIYNILTFFAEKM